jgi:hypothetical protein
MHVIYSWKIARKPTSSPGHVLVRFDPYAHDQTADTASNPVTSGEDVNEYVAGMFDTLSLPTPLRTQS